MAFLIGIDSGYFDLYDTPEDVCCINLDSNSLSHTKESKESIKRLPKKHAKVLKQTLEELGMKLKDCELLIPNMFECLLSVCSGRP
jgi:hypothetical protein